MKHATSTCCKLNHNEIVNLNILIELNDAEQCKLEMSKLINLRSKFILHSKKKNEIQVVREYIIWNELDEKHHIRTKPKSKRYLQHFE